MPLDTFCQRLTYRNAVFYLSEVFLPPGSYSKSFVIARSQELRRQHCLLTISFYGCPLALVSRDFCQRGPLLKLHFAQFFFFLPAKKGRYGLFFFLLLLLDKQSLSWKERSSSFSSAFVLWVGYLCLCHLSFDPSEVCHLFPVHYWTCLHSMKPRLFVNSISGGHFFY